MSVEITWIEWISGETPGTDNGTAATTINFGSTSARDLTPATYPITAGDASFTKYYRFQVSGSYSEISNAQLWKSAGDYKTEEDIQFSGSVAFATPTATDASDISIETSDPGVNNVGLNAKDESDLACTSRTLPHATEVESSPGYYSGSRSSLMRFQAITTSNTEAGAVNTKTISLSYDRQ